MVEKDFQERQYLWKSMVRSWLATKNIDMTKWLSLKRAVIIKLTFHSIWFQCPIANHIETEKLME